MYIMNHAGMYTCEILGAYEAGVTEDTYRLGFVGDEQKRAFFGGREEGGHQQRDRLSGRGPYSDPLYLHRLGP